MDHMLFNFANLPSSVGNWSQMRQIYIQGYYASFGLRFYMGMQQVANFYWGWNVRTIVRFCVVFLFLFLSGISCSFTRNNLQRFLKMSAAAALVTIVTYGLDMVMGAPTPLGFRRMRFFIVFGILHIMALNIGFYTLVKKIFKQYTPIFTLFAGLVFFTMAFDVPFWDTSGLPALTYSNDLYLYHWLIALSFYVFLLFISVFVNNVILPKIFKKRQRHTNINLASGLGEKKLSNKSISLIVNSICVVIIIVGTVLLFTLLPSRTPTINNIVDWSHLLLGIGRLGSDFYGVFPYLGVFLLGAAFGGIFYTNKKSLLPMLNGRWNTAIAFVGRNAIWMYLVHQVVFFLLTMGGALLVGFVF